MRRVAAAALILLVGACSQQPTEEPPEKTGAIIYQTRCVACHGPDAAGTEAGPDISGATAGQIRDAIISGSDVRPEFVAMPPIPMEGSQIDAVIAYLDELTGS